MFYKKRKAKYEAQIKELESKVQKLTGELHSVIIEPESLQAMKIVEIFKLRVSFFNTFWAGKTNTSEIGSLEGIDNAINGWPKMDEL